MANHENEPFTEHELTQGYWVKVGLGGINRVVKFSAGGSLTEQDLFTSLPFRGDNPKYRNSPSHCWGGKWRLEREGQELLVIVGPYVLHVEPDRKYQLHPGYEVNTDEPGSWRPFRFIHAG